MSESLISIIVPVYNEAETIAEVLRRLFSVSLPGLQKEVIVINDGSTDLTKQALLPFLKEIIYLEHDCNKGKGAAIKTGFEQARGELVVIQDGDLEYTPDEIPRLLAALRTHPEWDAVYGSRNLAPTGRGYSHYVAGVWLLTACVNAVFGSALTDAYTCYKLMRTSAFRFLRLKCNGFEIEMEITAKLLAQGKRIGEIPISYRPRSFKEGKKIRARDGIRGLLALCRVAFGARI